MNKHTKQLTFLLGFCLLSVALAGGGAGSTASTNSTSGAAMGGASSGGGPGGMPSGVFYTGHIAALTALSEVQGDGQKVTAAILEYDQPINAASLNTSTYSVSGRTVARVYTNDQPAKAQAGKPGEYVVLELSNTAGSNALMMSGKQGNSTSVSVTQKGSVQTVSGVTYAPPAKAIDSTELRTLVVDDFRQFKFTDPVTGYRLDYNLYIPKNYDPSKKYPLVLFMPDASTTGMNPYSTLTQGLGADIWASPSEQAKHAAFVLAPVYSSALSNDDSQTSRALDATAQLVQSLAGRYSLDQSRFYTTGQSGGCMASIAIQLKYPDLFAASFLVAGQWDPALVTPLANKKMWIVVSQDDNKAYPGMSAITSVLEKNGAKVSRAVWSGKATAAQFRTDVQTMLRSAPNANVHYVSFAKGTVIPADETSFPAAGHMNTWRVAYTIEGIRDWLFQQHK